MQVLRTAVGIFTPFCLSLFLLVNNVLYTKADIGKNCTSGSDCAATVESCDIDVCGCAEGYYDNNSIAEGGSCMQKVGLGESCPTGDACTGSQVQCSIPIGGGTCVCSDNYYDNKAPSQRACVQKVGLGESCPTGDACTGSQVQCSIPSGGGTCVCSANYYDNKATSQRACVQKVGLGESCPTGDACTGSQVQCSIPNGGGTCVCSANYYDNKASSQRACVQKVGLGESCPTGDACTGSQVQCSIPNGGGTCVCSANYYDNKASSQRACVQKVGLGESCPTGDACTGSQVQCSIPNGGGTCVCSANYYDNKASSQRACVQKVGLGESCPTGDACTGSQVQCSIPNGGGTCVCSANYYDNKASSQRACVQKVGLGESCPTGDACTGSQVQCSIPNGGGTCVCSANYYDNKASSQRACVQKVGLGESCPTGDACTGSQVQCSIPSGGGTCVCSANYYDNKASSQRACVQKVGLGESCPTGDACTGSQVQCSIPNGGGTCVCSANYYDNKASSQRACVQKVGLGESCPTGDACTGSQVQCSIPNGGGTCVCSANYYDNKASSQRACVQKVGLGESCPTGDACTGSQVQCSIPNGGGTCVCSANYYDNKATSQRACVQKVGLGESCPTGDACTGSQVQCSIPNGGGTCVCSANYYDNKATSQRACVQKVGLGSGCPQSDACVTANASCNISSAGVSNICVCTMDYYDNNGIEPNGTCNPISDLQVTSLNSSTISERSITVMWTAPAGKEHFIDHFVLIYGPLDNNGSEIVKNVTLTNVTLVNLVPGKKYRIRITSVNTQTALSERTIFNTFYKISKPSMPGNLLQRENIDVVSGNITLEWNISEGVVNGYAVSLTNETYQYNQSFGIITKAQQTFTEVRNGTRYGFIVYAVSGDTDTGVLNSEARIDFIKTTVTIPNPPTNLRCLNATDRTINLTWIQPLFPNGDILSYIIAIQRTDPRQEPYNLTSQGTNVQYIVDGLTAGSFYKFEVYTRNELHTSIYFATVASCQTRSQMAEMPADLQITDVTSRSGNVTWSKPTNFSGIHYGYSLQIRNGSSCIREVIWKCSGCEGSFPILSHPCTDISEQNASSTALQGPQYYVALDLFPDNNYTVTVAAITGIGIGHQATKYLPTKEEAPSKPWNVTVRNITDKNAIVEWNIDAVRPGQTNYSIIATGINPAEDRTHIVSGFFNRKYEFNDLEEYRNYSVIVLATTSIGSNRSDPFNFSTFAGPAGPVNNFNVDKGLGDDMYVKARVSWILPDELKRNGPINRFYVQQRENYGNGTSFKVTETNIKRENEDTYIYYVPFDVHPEANYTFMVRADTGNLTGEENVKNYSAPAGPPDNAEKQGVNVVPADKVSVRSKTSFRVEVNRSFFTSTRNGAIKDQGLICCKDPTCMYDNSTVASYEEMKNMMTYAQAKKYGSNKYRLPNMNTTREQVSGRRKRSDDNTYVYDVGIESCDGLNISQYCNGPLDPGSTYRIIAFACTSTRCTLSRSYGPFITLSVPSESEFPVGAVVGGIVGGLAGLAFIIVFIFFLRYRSNKGKRARKALDDSNDPSHMENLVKIKKQRPIRLANFAEYVADYHKDSNLKFSEEYEDLKTLSPQHSHEAAEMEENRLKNRFVNILPFDHSRVRLLPIDDVPGSDYINANFLPGFSKTREYIACQGPIPATIDDHWRLIWEQNVRVIVMLTQYKEENRVKCEPYMPLDLKDPKQYGDLVVECLTYSSMNSFEYRTLKIRLGEKERTIKHFHFLSWRDYSANVQFDTMIDFIKKVRSFIQPPDVEGPMIVHCSAGVGRTGTYITIDHVIQHIDKYGPDSTMDIFNFVLKMRENRTTMVQTEQQYIFIHDCIKEYLDRFKTYENQAFSSEDENLYQNTETIELYQNVPFNSTQKTEL